MIFSFKMTVSGRCELLFLFSCLYSSLFLLANSFAVSDVDVQPCRDNEFTCSESTIHHHCIPRNWQCDGDPDCNDGSDEKNCAKPEHEQIDCDPQHYFRCHKDGKCISLAMLCDGQNDCGQNDHSDEESCHLLQKGPVQCAEFTCADNRNCIEQKYRCDGIDDCPDGSDEKSCSDHCHEFLCGNGRCLSNDYVCDGKFDCEDSSDEANCSLSEKQVNDCRLDDGLFLCKDKSKCIPLDKVCNDERDCTDSSDESRFCKDHCAGVECEHKCVNLPEEYKCVCPKGYESIDHKCIDIDECSVFGFCDQLCKNELGSYKCYCHKGYMSVNNSCIAEGSEALLLYSLQNEIRGHYLTSNVYFPMITNIGKASGVSYDGKNVFWADIIEGEESIFMADEHGLKKEKLITAGIGFVEDLVVDWITKNIYFTDSYYSHIAVCSYDGINCATLIPKIAKPRAIALFSVKGIMFYTDWSDDHPHIGKSGMDGSNVINFISDNIKWPNGITVDLASERLYWADAHMSTIESVTLDGHDRRKLEVSKIEQPFSIDVFENRIYWSDWGTKGVESCNKFTGKDHETVNRFLKNILLGIHIYHPVLLQQQEKNPCKHSFCSHLCLLSPRSSADLTTICACPDHMELSENYHLCKYVSKPEHVIAASKTVLNIINYQRFGNLSVISLPQNIVKDLGALTYDANSGNLIMSDLSDGFIYLYNPKTFEIKKLYENQGKKIISIDFDPIGNNLYMADSVSKSIELLSMKTLTNIKLIWDLGNDIPLDLALASEDGDMFIALRSEKTSHIHIDKFQMNGEISSRVHMIEEEIIGPSISLSYDRSTEKLFWSDLGAGVIYSVNKDGSKKEKFKSPLQAVSDLAAVGDDMFWINFGDKVLHWASKTETNSLVKNMVLDSFPSEEIKLTKMSGATNIHHECQINNGGCSHICLPIGSGKKCMCPKDLQLANDNLKCQENVQECSLYEFKCNDGKCLPLDLKCNSKEDCLNGEDENDCEETIVSCPMYTFACLDGKQCIDSHKECDHKLDCDDGSDESHCTAQDECSLGEFQCKNLQCIHAAFQCDGKNDCDDKSDEEGCKDNKCNPEQDFKCLTGTCIPKSWECDGSSDCPDSSDEHKDCKKQCSAESEFQCTNGNCVHKILHCNEQDDCGDFSDEADCPKKVNFPEKEQDAECIDSFFLCSSDSTKCIPNEARCNGTAECPRSEDEEGCESCADTEFICMDTKKCISKEWVCDGANDCGDNSDEQHCPELHLSLRDDEKCEGIKCKRSHECIPFYKVCDGIKDCPDSSDEGSLCGQNCKNHICSHQCHQTPAGFKCSCPMGFKLQGDGHSCVDINECSEQVVCSQFCNNSVGTFKCSCKEDYFHLRKDKTGCKALGPEMKHILLMKNSLRTVSRFMTKVGAMKLDSIYEDINGLDFDLSSQHIYFTSENKGLLVQINLLDEKVVKISNLIKPTRIAFDWITKNIYIVENAYIIQVCNISRLSCAEIYRCEGGCTISAIRIDPLERLMFWSETHSYVHNDATSIILKSDMSAIGKKAIAQSEISKVGDIALDIVNKILYWTDTLGRKVEKITYTGGNRKLLFSNIQAEPLDLNLFEDHIYWLDGKPTSVHSASSRQNLITKCGLFGDVYLECESLKLLPQQNTDKIQRFRIFHQALQIADKNTCEALNCSYICALGSNGASCLCSDGSIIKSGLKCPETQNKNLYIDILETFEQLPDNGGSKMYWMFWILILPISIAVLWVFGTWASNFYKRYQVNRSSCPSMHFHNPGYELDSNNQENSTFRIQGLTPGDHSYENPLTKGNSWNVFNILRGKSNAPLSKDDDQSLLNNAL